MSSVPSTFSTMDKTDQVEKTVAPTRDFVDRHLALISALSLVVIAALRVLFVSTFDLPTALSVLAIVDRTQLLASSVLAAITVVLPVMFVQPSFRRWLLAGNRAGASFSDQLRTGLLWVPVGGIALFTFTIPLATGWFIGWLIYLVLMRRLKSMARRKGQEVPRDGSPVLRTESNNWLFATLLGSLLLTVMYQPWLAREAVELKGGDVVVASVVGTQGDMTLLLERAGAGATWVQTSSIEARSLCRTEPTWYGSSLSALIPRSGTVCSEITG